MFALPGCGFLSLFQELNSFKLLPCCSVVPSFHPLIEPAKMLLRVGRFDWVDSSQVAAPALARRS